MTTPAPLDITGTQVKMLRYPLTADARQALEAQDVTAPEFVALHLREATNREITAFEERQQQPFASKAEQLDWLAGLMARRAPEGLDPRVLRELVNDFTATDEAVFTVAYLRGEAISDPKQQEAISAAIQSMQNGLNLKLLTAFQNAG